jgi:hypothetical protein
MVEAIKHDAGSSLATTGWETVKGGLGGAVLAGVVGAVIAGGIVGGLAALAFSVPTALVLGGAAAIVGGGAAVTTAGPFAALIGAVTGFFSGRRQVGKENAKYELREAAIANERAQEQQAIAMAGAQQGYAMGFQHGQQKVVNDIQALQQQMLQQEMAKSVAAAPGSHAAKCGKCATESKAEAVAKQRDAQAAAGQQIG